MSVLSISCVSPDEKNKPADALAAHEVGLGSPHPALGRPPFARDFPTDPELDELILAFTRGQYDVVRRRAPILADRTSNPRVKNAAQELRRRLDVDPLAVKLIVAAVVLLAFLIYLAFSHLR